MNQYHICSCSSLCRKHVSYKFPKFDIFGCNNAEYNNYNIGTIGGIIRSIDYNKDQIVKELLCRIINDQSLNKLCSGEHIFMNRIYEIHFNNKNISCFGYNKYNGKEIGTLLTINGNILEYYDIIAIIIHQLVHCSYSEHNSQFLYMERKYREFYIWHVINYGILNTLNYNIFPISTWNGLHIAHKYINFNQKDSWSIYYYTSILIIITLVCSIYFITMVSFLNIL